MCVVPAYHFGYKNGTLKCAKLTFKSLFTASEASP